MEDTKTTKINHSLFGRVTWLLAFGLCLATILQSVSIFSASMRRAGLGYSYGPNTLSGLGSVRIEEVLPGSPAEAGGLRLGDVVTAYNGQPLVELIDFTAALAAANGQSDRMTVVRGGETLELSLTRAPGWTDPFAGGWMSLAGLPLGVIAPFGLALVVVFWLVYLAASIWIMVRGPSGGLPWVLALTLLFVGTAMPANEVVGWFDGPLGLPMTLASYTIPYALLFLLLVLLPDGRLTSPWMALPAVAFPLLVQIAPGLVWLLGIVTVFLLAGIGIVARRMPTMDEAGRERSKLIVGGVALLFVVQFLVALAEAVFPGAYRVTASLGFTLQLLLALVFPWLAVKAMQV